MKPISPPNGSLTLISPRDYGRAWYIRLWIWNKMAATERGDLTQSIYDFTKQNKSQPKVA